MIVFKNYLKVTRSFLSTIILYTLIFIAIAIMTTVSGSQQSQSFVTSQSSIALINHDQDTELIQTFQKYVQTHAQYVELEDSDDQLRDALFFRKVDYIMIIPKNFTDDFLNGKDIKIQTMEVPDSTSATYSKTLMNRFLNTAQLYLSAGISSHDLTHYIQDDLNIHTQVTMLNENHDGQISQARYFYNFSNYSLLAIIIVVISMVMISFCEDKIHRRHLISCVSYQSFNRQLLLGNVVVTLGIWLFYVMISFLLYQKAMCSIPGLLLVLNSFVFTIFVLIFSFFLTKLTHEREAISMISTVVSLGTSFIAGVFVPQEFLAPFVLNIAKLTPTYWFITGNNQIAQLSQYTMTDLFPVFMNMGIIVLFGIGFYFFTQFISRFQLKK
ncbi:ABC transporter permease [Candidatus Stoquefichus massiliensis]|uniref:ABC transporter permease n=1 Tax=Candidatus Stoquefichus massiliensis TaxID=1470350 RepID=UPI0004822483|nr:ABC transporter permease [Candidatus Stoquefichus massiliensis]